MAKKVNKKLVKDGDIKIGNLLTINKSQINRIIIKIWKKMLKVILFVLQKSQKKSVIKMGLKGKHIFFTNKQILLYNPKMINFI